MAEAPTGPERDVQGAADVGADIVRAGPAATVVSLAGAIDLATAHVLAAAVAGAVSAGGAGERIVLELNRVTFLGACGLGVILAAHGDAARRGITVVLVIDEVGPAALTLRFLPTGQGPAVYTTVTAALDSCAGSGTTVGHGGRPDRATSRNGDRTGREQR